MRFSIQTLLALMLLCGITFPLVMGLSQVRRDEALRAELENEIQSMRRQLSLDDTQLQEIWKHQQAEFASVHELRQRAERKFDHLQKKYGAIEDQGPDVLSLRTVPQIAEGIGSPATVFRLLVPTTRDVWLKYCLVQRRGHSRSPKDLDKIEPPTDQSGFEHSGMYEHKLAPGERFIAIQIEPARGTTRPINVRVDETELMRTQFSGDGEPSISSSYISGRQQVDFDRDRNLPWLLGLNARLRRENGIREDAKYAGWFWLSDQSSDAAPFPSISGAGESR